MSMKFLYYCAIAFNILCIEVQIGGIGVLTIVLSYLPSTIEYTSSKARQNLVDWASLCYFKRAKWHHCFSSRDRYKLQVKVPGIENEKIHAKAKDKYTTLRSLRKKLFSHLTFTCTKFLNLSLFIPCQKLLNMNSSHSERVWTTPWQRKLKKLHR